MTSPLSYEGEGQIRLKCASFGQNLHRISLNIPYVLTDPLPSLTEDIRIVGGHGHVLLPASQAGLLASTEVGLGDVINHQAERRELGRWKTWRIDHGWIFGGKRGGGEVGIIRFFQLILGKIRNF